MVGILCQLVQVAFFPTLKLRTRFASERFNCIDACSPGSFSQKKLRISATAGFKRLLNGRDAVDESSALSTRQLLA